MRLRHLIAISTPRTELLIITRTRQINIKCSSNARTLYATNLMGKEVISICPVDKYKLQVTVNEDSETR